MSGDEGIKRRCKDERRERKKRDGVMKLGPFGVAPESETPGWTHRRIKCVLPGDSLSVKAGPFLTVKMIKRQRPVHLDCDKTDQDSIFCCAMRRAVLF